jgi:hypothetical protein
MECLVEEDDSVSDSDLWTVVTSCMKGKAMPVTGRGDP